MGQGTGKKEKGEGQRALALFGGLKQTSAVIKYGGPGIPDQSLKCPPRLTRLFLILSETQVLNSICVLLIHMVIIIGRRFVNT